MPSPTVPTPEPTARRTPPPRTGPGSLPVLVPAAAAGDRAAWDALVERFSGLLWGVARSFRLAEDDAADVVQTTWLKLLEHLDRIDEPLALPGWLATTARREALHLLQRRGRDTTGWDDDLGERLVDPQAAALDAGLLEDERDAALWLGFARLSARCQRLLRVLMACDRPSYKVVGQELGLPVGSIGPTRMRCLASLEGILRGCDYAFDGPAGGQA